MPNVNLPAGIATISVPVFVNKSPVFNIEQYITQKTIDGFIADGKLSVVDEEKADAVLKCRIKEKDYIITPIRFDVNQVPQEYRLRIYVDVYFFDNKAQRLLWKDEGRIWEETTYFVTNNLGMPVEDETIGRNRVMDKLAEKIVRRVIYGW